MSKSSRSNSKSSRSNSRSSDSSGSSQRYEKFWEKYPLTKSGAHIMYLELRSLEECQEKIHEIYDFEMELAEETDYKVSKVPTEKKRLHAELVKSFVYAAEDVIYELTYLADKVEQLKSALMASH